VRRKQEVTLRSGANGAGRLAVQIEAIAAAAGLKDHDYGLNQRSLLVRKLAGRRPTSRLPALLDFALTRPVVWAGMVAEELRITPRAAQDLVTELGLREATGRGRYRAWGDSLKDLRFQPCDACRDTSRKTADEQVASGEAVRICGPYCPKFVYGLRTDDSPSEKKLQFSDMNSDSPDLKTAMLDRIRADAPRKVWTPSDFVDLASRDAVDKALQRLTKAETTQADRSRAL